MSNLRGGGSLHQGLDHIPICMLCKGDRSVDDLQDIGPGRFSAFGRKMSRTAKHPRTFLSQTIRESNVFLTVIVEPTAA